jgi:hypothetical protein
MAEVSKTLTVKTFNISLGCVTESKKPGSLDEVRSEIEQLQKKREGWETNENEVDYVGYGEDVDFEPDKLKCSACRKMGNFRLGRERE